MDFAKKLANLQKSASRSRSRQESQQGGEREDRGRDNEEHRNVDRDRDRDYRHHHNSRRDHQGYRDRSHRNYRHEPYNNRHSRRGEQAHSRRNNRHTNNYNSEAQEYYLPKLIKAIPKYQPIQIQKMKQTEPKQRHICLLFLTIDDLPLEHIWKAFLNNLNSNGDGGVDKHVHANGKDTNHNKLMVSVICHAKFPDRVKSPWLKQRLLVTKPSLRDLEADLNSNSQRDRDFTLPRMEYHSRRPEWGSVEITRAMTDLLDEGLKLGTQRDNNATNAAAKILKDSKLVDEYKKRYSSRRYIASRGGDDADNQHQNHLDINRNVNVNTEKPIPTVDRFVFASESCMPVTTLQEFEAALFENTPDSDGKVDPDPTTRTNNVYDETGTNKSWLKYLNAPNDGHARQKQWDVMHPSIPEHCIHKSDQWIVLTRHHAWPIASLIDETVKSVIDGASADNRDRDGQGHGGSGSRGRYGNHSQARNRNSQLQLGLWQCFRDMNASDEMYFPTVMGLLGILGDRDRDSDTTKDKDNELAVNANAKVHVPVSDEKKTESGSEVAKRRVTYCDWTMKNKNPETFVISRKDKFRAMKAAMKLARAEKCLFARKFKIDDEDKAVLDVGKTGTGMTKDTHMNATNPIEEGYVPRGPLTGDEWFTFIMKLKTTEK